MNAKKLIRAAFRNAVFKRDNYCCKICGFKSTPEKAEKDLDSHHIVNRNFMPFEGYVASNGISLCSDRIKIDNCHQKAEEFHSTGISLPNFFPLDLYKLIGSNYKEAYIDSLKLGSVFIDKNLLSIIESKEMEIYAEKSDTSWLLVCETFKIFDPLIINYSKGRNGAV